MVGPVTRHQRRGTARALPAGDPPGAVGHRAVVLRPGVGPAAARARQPPPFEPVGPAPPHCSELDPPPPRCNHGPVPGTAPAPPPAADTILSARDVRKVYRTGSQEVEALRDVSLDVATGDMVMVMGPSGNGKTTLLNCLAGLDDIDDGVVLVDGDDIHRMSDGARTEHRAQRMGFIFQAFNLIPVFSAVENVELPLLVGDRRPAEARRRAVEMLERVGLGDRLDHRPTELSGGEQQRVAVARALVSEPAIVWADEPTGNLDSHTAGSVLELLHEVHDSGQTLVVVTHDRGIGLSGQRLVQVRDGTVVYDGPPSEDAVDRAVSTVPG
ncbi:MAG: ATP-binding cassette domain-containing protein [Acidimicrobiia bacterium]|nr:ATP-binding cassette domain-containing protein [Acidimicrobiia bacterium]